MLVYIYRMVFVMRVFLIIGFILNFSYLFYGKLNKNLEKNDKAVNILLIINILFIIFALLF